MTAFKVKLEVLQGATFSKQAIWKAGTPPVPVDLTGCTARMQVRTKIESPDVLLELTTENNGIVIGAADGTVTLKISATQTAAIAWTGGVYDLEILFPDGTVRRLLAGSVSVSPEVTR